MHAREQHETCEPPVAPSSPSRVPGSPSGSTSSISSAIETNSIESSRSNSNTTNTSTNARNFRFPGIQSSFPSTSSSFGLPTPTTNSVPSSPLASPSISSPEFGFGFGTGMSPSGVAPSSNLLLDAYPLFNRKASISAFRLRRQSLLASEITPRASADLAEEDEEEEEEREGNGGRGMDRTYQDLRGNANESPISRDSIAPTPIFPIGSGWPRTPSGSSQAGFFFGRPANLAEGTGAANGFNKTNFPSSSSLILPRDLPDREDSDSPMTSDSPAQTNRSASSSSDLLNNIGASRLREASMTDPLFPKLVNATTSYPSRPATPPALGAPSIQRNNRRRPPWQIGCEPDSSSSDLIPDQLGVTDDGNGNREGNVRRESGESLDGLSESLGLGIDGEGFLTPGDRQAGPQKRAVSRRSNLLPKSKGYLRVAAQLQDETIHPEEVEIESEAALHRLSKAGVSTVTPKSNNSGSSTSIQKLPSSSSSGRPASTPNRFPESVGEEDDDDQLSSGSDIGGGDAGRAGSEVYSNSGMNEDGASDVAADEGEVAAKKAVAIWTGFREPSAGPSVRHSPSSERSFSGRNMDIDMNSPSTPSWAGVRPGKRKAMDERFEPYSAMAFKRRAVSPSPSLGNSPGLASPVLGPSAISLANLPSGGLASAASGLPNPQVPGPTSASHSAFFSTLNGPTTRSRASSPVASTSTKSYGTGGNATLGLMMAANAKGEDENSGKLGETGDGLNKMSLN